MVQTLAALATSHTTQETEIMTEELQQGQRNQEILYGLEEYLRFKDSDPEHLQFIRDFVNILNSEDVGAAVTDYCVKNLQKLDQGDKIFRSINTYRKKHSDPAIYDAFSRSQIKSKIWLITELARIQKHWESVAIFAGWFGQLKSVYERRLTYSQMRIIELDRQACETSDYIFNLSNLENHKVKAVSADINKLTLHRNGYEWSVENFREGTSYVEKFLPNLIINTSAEHMTEDWFFQIKHKDWTAKPTVAIQSNNLFDLPEHVNCVHSVDHMLKKFPLEEVLFAGELQLKGYKRVMLIGRP